MLNEWYKSMQFEKASAAVDQEVSLRKVAEKRHLELMEKVQFIHSIMHYRDAWVTHVGYMSCVH